jgi:hypothetical protein
VKPSGGVEGGHSQLNFFLPESAGPLGAEHLADAESANPVEANSIKQIILYLLSHAVEVGTLFLGKIAIEAVFLFRA